MNTAPKSFRVGVGRVYALMLLTAALGMAGCGGGGGSGSGSGSGGPAANPPPTPAASKLWTWVGGANTANAHGSYGSLGVGSTSNAPGARLGAVTWRDGSGNLWLFGGSGYDSTGAAVGALNDLWEYVPSTQQWTWVSGANTTNARGSYGTLGTGSTSNAPGARSGAVAWSDNSGNLWLFGGSGYDATGAAVGSLNDLWEYLPASNQWKWVSGANTFNAHGSYGTLGAGSTANVPGARSGAVAWSDGGGNLWLFGGSGYDATGAVGALNDLWEYVPSSNQWKWVSGANTVNARGTYVTLGAGSTAAAPGARSGAAAWSDGSGNLWLLGGSGYDSAASFGDLNDLWEYVPSTQQWKWLSGVSTANAHGIYGTLGAGSMANAPGARSGAAAWSDSSGNLWLLGGEGYDVLGTSLGDLNDLWEYVPSTQQWKWVSGANTANAQGSYGTLGAGSSANTPGARYGAAVWSDAAGNHWLLGGSGYDAATTVGVLNDLWRY